MFYRIFFYFRFERFCLLTCGSCDWHWTVGICLLLHHHLLGFGLLTDKTKNQVADRIVHIVTPQSLNNRQKFPETSWSLHALVLLKEAGSVQSLLLLRPEAYFYIVSGNCFCSKQGTHSRPKTNSVYITPSTEKGQKKKAAKATVGCARKFFQF